MAASSFPTAVTSHWPALCLDRLRYLLTLTPEDAPLELTAAEAFALIEWTRIALFAECHAAGEGHVALALLKAASPAPDDALADRGAY